MAYYTYMSPNWQKVYWIYGFEIDYDTIERIDKERSFFSSSSSSSYTTNYPYANSYDYANSSYPFEDDECFTDPTERVTSFLRSEFDCIAPMLGWDPDSPTKEKTYVLVVHANDIPKRVGEREAVLRRVRRVKRELMVGSEVGKRAKWYFACEAGVFKRDVDWGSRPAPLVGSRKKVQGREGGGEGRLGKV